MDTKFLIVLFTFLPIILAFTKTYNGYKVYEVRANKEEQLTALRNVQNLEIGELWEDQVVLNQILKVMVSKDNQTEFLQQMKNAEIETNEIIADLQKLIEDQLKPAEPTSRLHRESLHSMTWDRYYSLSQIHTWLDELAAAYPNIVSTVVWGRTNENREIKGIIINHNRGRPNRRIGVIEGALHAREWITPATITWIIKEFLTSNDPEVRALAENFEWHILPIANPDGYSYTFTNNRMWRKNRNTSYGTNCTGADNDMSNGVDLNRNFGFQWMTIGASSDPCSNTFAGSAAFSEPETRAIVNYLQDLRNNGQIIYYLAFHSYTQLVIVPYSHITSVDNPQAATNYADLFEIGTRAAAKLEERFGTQYRVGISANVMYLMSGTSFDWVKSELDVPICYLLELRDLGVYGFLLPPEEIIPNNLEIMDFLLEMDKNTRILGYYQ